MLPATAVSIVKWNKKKIPKQFIGTFKDLLYEGDAILTKRSRLKYKILIFSSAKQLRIFWKKKLNTELGRKSVGVVSSMIYSVIPYKGKPYTRVDKNYFCIIGLALGHISTEIINHEACHVGFAYHKRVVRNVWGPIGDFDEEQVAYPCGVAASAITQYLNRKGISIAA